MDDYTKNYVPKDEHQSAGEMKKQMEEKPKEPSSAQKKKGGLDLAGNKKSGGGEDMPMPQSEEKAQKLDLDESNDEHKAKKQQSNVQDDIRIDGSGHDFNIVLRD